MSEYITFEASGREFIIATADLPEHYNEPIVVTNVETQVSETAKPTREANLTDPQLGGALLIITALSTFAVRSQTANRRY